NGVTKFTVGSDEVTRHIPLLKRMIKLYGYGNALSYEEKYSAGLVGIALALEKYDPSRDVKFSYWISYQIDRAIRTEARRAANHARRMAQADSDEAFDPIDERSLATEDDRDSAANRERLSNLAMEVVKTPPPKERSITLKLYVEGKTQSEVAVEEGVAQSWISRVAKSALGKVKREMIRRMDQE
ncbi:MAG: sigma-70 family RNA polymerase sigma factor, partial [Thermoguttaceae bacterium]|nr:sigma-70 family RNA polymerase sigma factor [Thermoguttaceae bacterium]